MRDAKVPYLHTDQELSEYIRTLVDRPHDYGTCVYAMSMAATAAFNYVAHKLGTTGFQAGCADMDILRRTRGWKWGKILDYDNLLYPQYCNEEHFPGWQTILQKNALEFADRAKALLAENKNGVSPSVRAHWEKLAAEVPS